MTERLTAGLSPETLRALSALTLDEQVDAPVVKKQRTPLKDVPYVEQLDENPELASEIATAMGKLKLAGLELPVFHITSRAIRFPDGSEESTGYLENIQAAGLRARDTNVAAFMEKGPTTHIGDPEYFAENPHKLLRAMGESLGRYAHHGSRTNKQSLGEQRDAGVGVPTMIVIDATHTPLSPGSDYDDHFKLGQQVPPDHIMGTIDLEGRRSRSPEDVTSITRDFLAVASQYADAHHMQPA